VVDGGSAALTAASQARALDRDAIGVLDTALKATRAYERPDLGQRLAYVRQRTTDPRMRVLVVGEFKQGKSSLVNATVNADVCPVDDDVATSVPTVVHYAAQATAVALHAPDHPDDQPRAVPVAVEQIGTYVSEAGNPANERNLRAVEIGVPRDLLRSGLALVDTPGVGGLGSAHSAATVGALPTADAVILCTDASQELTAPEIAFMRTARDLCPTIACVVTKIDFYGSWRRIVELDRAHLERAGIDAPVIATSAALRTQAIVRNDRALNTESGYPQLLAFLRDRVVNDVRMIARRQVAHTVTEVTEQLERRFTAERAAIADPEHSSALMARLTAAQEQSTALRSQAARWQQTLSDGFADLSADAEHDLRGRMRDVAKQVESSVADIDPGAVWEQFEQWLYRTVAAEVSAHYAMVARRARALARTVAEHFTREESAATQQLTIDAPVEILSDIAPMERVDSGKSGAGAKGLTALRSSYGGMMMIGSLGRVIGMGLFNPLSIGFGLVMGRKAIKDEREKAVKQRREETKQAARTYIDEINFNVGKDAKDVLRRLQRTLRDRYTRRADELQRTTGDALKAAQQAVQTSTQEQQRRLRDIDAELSRIRTLRTQAERLT
jgi:Dynamin family